jgi:hypothetical protein
MKLMVPTIMCEAVVAKEVQVAGQTWKVGEIAPIAYGPALQLRAVGFLSGFKDEDETHLKAAEALAIYGGDCWFPAKLQTVTHLANYLAEQGIIPHSTN